MIEFGLVGTDQLCFTDALLPDDPNDVLVRRGICRARGAQGGGRAERQGRQTQQNYRPNCPRGLVRAENRSADHTNVLRNVRAVVSEPARVGGDCYSCATTLRLTALTPTLSIPSSFLHKPSPLCRNERPRTVRVAQYSYVDHTHDIRDVHPARQSRNRD